MRLIDADKISESKFHPLPYTHITPTDVNAESYKRGWNDAIDAIIADAPTIEAQPERTGKWIDCGWSVRCSECDYFMPWAVRNYCPSCGTRMLKEGEKHD
jgi:hypothetical protein